MSCALACPQAIYALFRMWYLWESFSSWHIGGFCFTSTVYALCYFLLHKSATPIYAPLAQGGALISGGEDLDQKGLIEYTWDMLYMTMFIQVGAVPRCAGRRWPIRGSGRGCERQRGAARRG